MSELFLPFMLLALYLLKYCSNAEKTAVKIGMWISFGSLIATLLLTNLSFFNSLHYMILGVALSFLPICSAITEKSLFIGRRKISCTICLVGIFLTVLFRYSCQVFPLDNVHIWDVRKAITAGPATGIISTWFGAYKRNVDLAEWPEYVKSGDNVLLVTIDGISSLGYLYADANVCVDSTICTPTFDEKLLRYWELNPHKKPNVVAVNCWFGQLTLDSDSWIMQWINEEFGEDSYRDGTYWRFYRR